MVMRRLLVTFLASLLAFAPIANADTILPTPQIDTGGNVNFRGGPTIGHWNGVYFEVGNAYITPQGGTRGLLSTLLGDVSALLYYVPTLSAKVTIANLLNLPVTPKWWGATCDGTHDDTSAILSFATLTTTRSGRYDFPDGACTFTSTLTFNAVPGAQINGAGAYATELRYTGTSTTNDIIVLGGSSATGGTGYFHAGGFRVTSTTKMTAGAGIHVKNTSFVNLKNTVADGQNGNGNLWNGYWFDETGFNILDDFIAAGAQNDGVLVTGPGVGTGANPQYDFFGSNGKIGGNKNCGWHVGGGFDGAHLDTTEVTTNKYGVCIDHAVVVARVQEVFIGSLVNIDQSTSQGVVINESLCSDDPFYGIVDIRAQITNSVGNGVQVLSFPGCHLNVAGPSVSWNGNTGFDIEDGTVKLTLSPETQVMRNRNYGVYSGANTTTFTNTGRSNVSMNGNNAAIGSWSNANGGQINFTTATPHGFATNSVVTTAGFSPAAYNGTFVAGGGTAGTAIIMPLASNPGAVTVNGYVTSSGTSNFSPTIVGTGLDNSPGAVANTLTPGGSPWTWAATIAGTFYIAGTGVTAVTMSRPFSTSILTGITNGGVQVRNGDAVTTTWSGAAPTFTFVPN